jgi:hypothetical protein
MDQSNAPGPAGRHVERDLEDAEDYLSRQVLVHAGVWPEHYREALGRLEALVAKMLDDDQADELADALAGFVGTVEAFQLRIGFSLGRTWAAFGELTDADCCRALEAAGGNPGRAFVEAVERELLGIVQ